MIYRCLVCGYEEARGCLPTASCGLYLFLLLGLSAGCQAGVIHSINRVLRGTQRDLAQPQAEDPWWVYVAICVLGLLLLVVGAAVVKYLLEVVEYLVFARRRCERCGARRWSRGFTRGFGL